MQNQEVTATLKDGTPILISIGNPCDKECISQGFAELSAHSRYMRFFSGSNKLTDAQLEHLTNVDNINHVVVAATDIGEEMSHGVGLGRYVRLVDEPDVAEFSITIADDFQNKGAGTILFDALKAHARKNSIRVLRGYVLAVNISMIRLLKRHNAKHIKEADGTLRFDVELT